MIRFGRIIIASAFLFLVGCGEDFTVKDPENHVGMKVDINQFPDVPNSIYGAWTGPAIASANGMTLVPQVFLNNRGKVSFSMVCTMPNSLILHSTIEEYLVMNRVELSISKESIYQHTDGSTCSIRVESGITSFYFSHGKLIVQNQNSAPAEFKRIRF